jgi:hypothetical protein
MRRMTTRVFTLIAVVSILAVVSASPALAHEARKVGRWNFVVGWGTEPAYAGFPNTVQLILTNAKDVGLADLGDTLKVDVTSAGKTTSLSFEPFFEEGEFGTVGDYRGKVIPTRPGTYEFRIYGTIKGDKVDQKFTCSETTFDCIDDPSEVEFPAQDPSSAQLAERITKEAARVTASAKDANDAAKLAKTLGYVGIGLGALALIVALARGRGSKKTAA